MTKNEFCNLKKGDIVTFNGITWAIDEVGGSGYFTNYIILKAPDYALRTVLGDSPDRERMRLVSTQLEEEE